MSTFTSSAAGTGTLLAASSSPSSNSSSFPSSCTTFPLRPLAYLVYSAPPPPASLPILSSSSSETDSLSKNSVSSLPSSSPSSSSSSCPSYWSGGSLSGIAIKGVTPVASFELWHSEPKLPPQQVSSSHILSKKKGSPKRGVISLSVDNQQYSISYKLIAAKNFSNRNNIKSYTRCEAYACGRYDDTCAIAMCSLLDKPEHAHHNRPLTSTTLSSVRVRPKLIGVNTNASPSSSSSSSSTSLKNKDDRNPPFLISTGRRDKPGGTCVIVFSSNPSAIVRIHDIKLDEASIKIQCTNWHMNAHPDPNFTVNFSKALMPGSSSSSPSSTSSSSSNASTSRRGTKSIDKKKRRRVESEDESDEEEELTVESTESSSPICTRKRIFKLPDDVLGNSEDEDSSYSDSDEYLQKNKKKSALTPNTPKRVKLTPAPSQVAVAATFTLPSESHNISAIPESESLCSQASYSDDSFHESNLESDATNSPNAHSVVSEGADSDIDIRWLEEIDDDDSSPSHSPAIVNASHPSESADIQINSNHVDRSTEWFNEFMADPSSHLIHNLTHVKQEPSLGYNQNMDLKSDSMASLLSSASSSTMPSPSPFLPAFSGVTSASNLNYNNHPLPSPARLSWSSSLSSSYGVPAGDSPLLNPLTDTDGPLEANMSNFPMSTSFAGSAVNVNTLGLENGIDKMWR